MSTDPFPLSRESRSIMKLTASKQLFLEAVNLVAAVVPPRSQQPILQNFRLDAEQDRVELLGTDLEVAVRRRLEQVTVEVEGSILLPAARLQAVLRELQDDTVSVQVDGNLVLIRTNDGEFKLVGGEPAEFPSFAAANPAGFVELTPSGLLDGLEAVEFSAAKDLGRYAVNGVLFRIEEGRIELAATDGRRLAHFQRPLGADSVEPAKAIISVKGVSLFRKSLVRDEELVGLRLEPGRAVLRTANTEISARAVEGDFPDYQRVLKKNPPHSAVVETTLLHSAIRKAAIMAGDDVRAVTLRFGPDGLELSSKEEGRGEVRTVVALEHDASETHVRINPDFLMEFLRLNHPEKIPFRFGGQRDPLIFRPSEESVYFVSPVTTE